MAYCKDCRSQIIFLEPDELHDGTAERRAFNFMPSGKGSAMIVRGRYYIPPDPKDIEVLRRANVPLYKPHLCPPRSRK